MATIKKLGRIRRILKDGYAYIDFETDKKQYIASFSTIPNYKGETEKELKLHTGSKVQFEIGTDEKMNLVTKLEILNKS